MNQRSTAELDAEARVAQDYRRFLIEAEQLLQNAKQLSGDSAVLLRQKLEDRVAQAKVGLEGIRRAAAEERHQAGVQPSSHNKLLWVAGAAVAGLALAAYLYSRRS